MSKLEEFKNLMEDESWSDSELIDLACDMIENLESEVRTKHWQKGRYVISEVVSIFGKKQFWITRINSTTSVYCWTHYSDEDDKTHLENFNGYITLFNMRVDGKQYVEEYSEDLDAEVKEIKND